MIADALRRAARSPLAIDATLTLLVAIVSFGIAYRSLATFSAVPWIEDLLVPCTARPGWVTAPEVLNTLPQWQAFLSRQIEYFPCEALHGVPLVEVGVSWRQSEYFHRLLGLWFQVIGPTINAFVGFQAAFHAATCAIAYLIFRLGLWRIVALAGAAGLAWSSWHLTAVAMPIEYAKAPWMLAAVALCGLLLRRDGQGKPLRIPALALGLVVGIGIGFKADLMAAVPLALITTTLFVRGTSSAPSRKLEATWCVVLGIAAGSAGVLWRTLGGETGSLLAVQFLGGLAWTTEGQHAVNPLYDYGLAFDDSHITVLINSYAQRVLGATQPMHFLSREMQQASTQLLWDIWSTFPGDFVLRVIAATLRVLQLNGYGLPLAVAGLFAVFARSPRAGWFVAVATVYLSAYVSLVFQRRHFYHLEFISWGLSGAVIQALLMPHRWAPVRITAGERWRQIGGRALTAAIPLLVIAAGALAVLTAARTYQEGAVLRLVDGHIRAAREPRGTRSTSTPAGETLVRIDGVSADDQQVWRADQMAGDYAAISFACWEAAPIEVAAKYRPPGQGWDRTFRIPCGAPGQSSTLMLPIYQYGFTYRFEGLMMSDRAAAALRSVSLVTAGDQPRLWLPLRLPEDWQTRSRFAIMRTPLETP